MSPLTGAGRVTNLVTATSVVMIPPVYGTAADDSVAVVVMSLFTPGLVSLITPVTVSSPVGSLSSAIVGTVVGITIVGTPDEEHDTYD